MCTCTVVGFAANRILLPAAGFAWSELLLPPAAAVFDDTLDTFDQQAPRATSVTADRHAGHAAFPRGLRLYSAAGRRSPLRSGCPVTPGSRTNGMPGSCCGTASGCSAVSRQSCQSRQSCLHHDGAHGGAGACWSGGARGRRLCQGALQPPVPHVERAQGLLLGPLRGAPRARLRHHPHRSHTLIVISRHRYKVSSMC